MNKANIVLGYTPYHSLVTEQIIKNLQGETFCLFTKRWPNGTYRSLCSKNFSAIGNIGQVFELFSSASKIRKILANYKHVCLYLPHPCHLIGNFLFFHEKITEIHIYEDGLLNYYDAKTRDMSKSKALIARLLRIPYRNYMGHLCGFNARQVSAVHLTRPEHSVTVPCGVELKKLTLTTSKKFQQSNTLLFLDQDTRQTLTPLQRDQALAKAEQIAQENNLKIVFKGHHEQSNTAYSAESPSSNEPAELSIYNVQPKIVASFFSSALINIKQIEPRIRCVALAPHMVEISINEMPVPLSVIFEAAGVECI